MIIKGKAIADEIYARLSPREISLGILIGEKTPVIDSFVKIKEKAAERLGVKLVRTELEENANTDDTIAAVEALAEKCDGIIVQLPLPLHIDAEKVLAAIPPEKDVDGLSKFPIVRPPVAEAVREILEHEQIPIEGQKVIIVGQGRLVGRPVSVLLSDLGADVSALERGDMLDALKIADIVVLGAGEPGFIKPEHLKQGVVLIDAGTSEDGGKVKGDADPACAEIASVFTPVPGGVGPISVAMIFKNLWELAEKKPRSG